MTEALQDSGGSKRLQATLLLATTAVLLIWQIDRRIGAGGVWHLMPSSDAWPPAAAAAGPALRHFHLPLQPATQAQPPSPPTLEAAMVAQLCSPEYRAQHAAAVASGAEPALLGGARECEALSDKVGGA